MKFLTIAALILACLAGFTLAMKSYHEKKAANVLWSIKNKDFPESDASKKNVEPQAYVSPALDFMLLGKGGKTLMFCNGIDKCVVGYGVTFAELQEGINELFMSLAMQTRNKQQQAMQQISPQHPTSGANSPAVVAPKATPKLKPQSMEENIRHGVYQHSTGANSPNILGANNVAITNK